MWGGHHPPFSFGWQQQQQWQQQNPTPQSTDPVEWAAKAAQWAQQKQIQDHYYQEQQQQIQQQQQLQQQQQIQQQLQLQQQQQIQQQLQMQMQATQQAYVQEQQQHMVGAAEFGQAEGQDVYMQHQQQQPLPVESSLPPKPLFDDPPMQQGPGGHSQHGFEGGIEGPPDHPSFQGSPHMGIEQMEEEEGAHELREHRLPPGEHFSRQRGPCGGNPRGDFHPRRGFHSPHGRGGLRPRFSPRGTPRFSPRNEGGHSPRTRDNDERVFSGHRGPTEMKFDRGPVHEEPSMFDQEEQFQRNFPREGREVERSSGQGSFIQQLEAVKKQELEKKQKLKRELERIQAVERQRKLEMEKKLEMERKREIDKELERKRQEAERAKKMELEQKRLKEEAIAKREKEELEKKRQMDLQLAQEIENKKREMERILEQKERMERELMEKQVELGRMGMGGGGGGEMWGGGEIYQSDQQFGRQERPDQPTIPSWKSDPSAIPGLGDLGSAGEEDRVLEGGGEKTQHRQDTQSQAPPPAKKEETTQMMESLGKIVSQLQTLQGLTSSLKLLHTMPKEEGGREGGSMQGGSAPSEGERAAIREKELSEDTKRKVAALLANESDSDGEQDPKSKPRREGEMGGAAAAAAREFDGTYNIQPQVYGTYAAEQYGKDRDDPSDPYKHSEGITDPYKHSEGRTDPYKHSEGITDPYKHGEGPPRYSKFDYVPRDEDREPRAPYRGYPPQDVGGREGDHRYPRSLGGRPPPDPEVGGRDYPPYPGGVPREEGDWKRGQPSPPPPMPPRDYPHGRPPYGDSERSFPPPVRARPPPPDHPDDYRGPPPPSDPYYHHPPPEPRRGAGIFSQMESIDYSHGGNSSAVNVKSVDYHHGTQSGGYPPVARDIPPGGGGFPYGSGGGYGATYGEGGVAGSYMQFGGYMNPAGGLDPAAIFAAYQGGESKRRTLPLWLREELEKLERKKAKQLEKEARERAFGETEGRPKWAEELERDREREEEEREREREGEKWKEWQGRWAREEEEEEEKGAREKPRLYRQRSHSSSHSGEEGSPHSKKRHYEPPEDSEEDKHLGLVMRIRQMLTEVLLEVTNQEIEAVATEAVEEAKKPKLVIQMKGVANLPSKDNRQLLGLGVYSSESDSDSGGSHRDGKPRSSRDGKSSSSGKSSKGKSGKAVVTSKLPKPEEIAAAFKDTTAAVSGKDKPAFMPRAVQEKQRDGGKTSSSSSLKVKEKGKKAKDKYVEEHDRESSRDKGKEKKDHEKDRKREKDRESDRDSSSSSSRKKSSSSSSSRDKKDSRRGKESDKERERGGKERASSGSRDAKHSPSESKSSSTKFRRSSGQTSSDVGTVSSGSGSSKSRMRSSSRRSHSRSPPMIPGGRRSRSRSPVLHMSSSRIVEIANPRSTAVPTGKGSIQTTKGFVSSFPPAIPPFGSREVRNRSPSPPPDTDMSYRFFGRRNSKSGQY